MVTAFLSSHPGRVRTVDPMIKSPKYTFFRLPPHTYRNFGYIFGWNKTNRACISVL